MPELVSVRQLTEEVLALGNRGFHLFLNPGTTQTYSGHEDYIVLADEGTDPEEIEALKPSEKAIVAILQGILRSPDWIRLPTRQSRDDYHVMERFCVEQCEEELQEHLLSVIQGEGAFRRFRIEVQQRGIEQEWLDFRFAAVAEEVEAWLDANGYEFQA